MHFQCFHPNNSAQKGWAIPSNGLERAPNQWGRKVRRATVQSYCVFWHGTDPIVPDTVSLSNFGDTWHSVIQLRAKLCYHHLPSSFWNCDVIRVGDLWHSQICCVQVDFCFISQRLDDLHPLVDEGQH